MAQSNFTYLSYIRTTPERLWSALTDTEILHQYWLGIKWESQFTAGSPWKMILADGEVVDAGTVVSVEPLRRLVLRWRHQKNAELKAEGESICTMELESTETSVKLSVTHTIDREPSKFIAAISVGWPQIISNLKSLLETGSTIDVMHIHDTSNTNFKMRQFESHRGGGYKIKVL